MEPIKNYLNNPIRPQSTPTVATPRKPKEVCDPDCPLCGGIGWIRYETESIYDPNFGKMFHCPNLDPFKIYGSKLGVFEDERNLSWQSIVDNNNVMKAVEVVRKTLKDGYGWVYLWGNYGLAKTLILKIAVVETIKTKIIPSAYVRMAEIIENVRQSFDSEDPSEEAQRRLDFWVDLPVLAIDEFDVVRETPYANEKKFLLMDKRYESACRMKNVTLMASNQPPENYDGYLSDRILDGRFKVIKLTGKSARGMMTY